MLNFNVSIHAPVMDAKVSKLALMSLKRFNPRARDGRERKGTPDGKIIVGFNPRARDGREDAITLVLLCELFQSTRP